MSEFIKKKVNVGIYKKKKKKTCRSYKNTYKIYK